MLNLLVILLLSGAQAALKIPTNMTAQDRQTALEILGYGSAYKLLGDPFPLGGYSGFEVGISTEIINTSEIARLGSKDITQNETSLNSISIGKGLFNDIDLFVQLTPGANSENLSSFGGQFRWGFYQGEYVPIYLSVIMTANSTNFQELIAINTQGADLVAGFNVEDVTLYFGTGILRAQGRFMGGLKAITDVADPHGEQVDGVVLRQSIEHSTNDAHYLAGINLRFNKVFIAMQIDRITQAVYSAKLGLRF